MPSSHHLTSILKTLLPVVLHTLKEVTGCLAVQSSKPAFWQMPWLGASQVSQCETKGSCSGLAREDATVAPAFKAERCPTVH